MRAAVLRSARWGINMNLRRYNFASPQFRLHNNTYGVRFQPLSLFSTKREDDETKEEELASNSTDSESKISEDEEEKEDEGKEKEESGFKMPNIEVPPPREAIARAYTMFLDAVDFSKEQIALAYKELTDSDEKKSATIMRKKVRFLPVHIYHPYHPPLRPSIVLHPS